MGVRFHYFPQTFKQTNFMVFSSVIIPTYNRKKLLDLTLRSLTKQTIGPKAFEVIVIDDGSDDNTFELIAKYKPLLNIKYFYRENDVTTPERARNLGVQKAEADLCIFIDSGVIVSPYCIQAYTEYHSIAKEPVALIGYVYGFDSRPQIVEDLDLLIMNTPDTEMLFKEVRENPQFKDVRDNDYIKYGDRIDLLPAPWVYYWTCNTSMLKSSLMEGEEPFDLLFENNHGYEDVDLAYRLHKAGVKIVLNRLAEAIHFPHPKIESLHESQWLNVQKFHNKHQSPETTLFHDLVKSGIQDLDFNKYIFERTQANKSIQANL